MHAHVLVPCMCAGSAYAAHMRRWTSSDVPMQASGCCAGNAPGVVCTCIVRVHACAAAQPSGLPLAKGAQTPTPTTLWLARAADCTGATCRAEAIEEIEEARLGVGVGVKVRVRVRVRAGARVSALDLGPVRHLDELELGLALSPTDTQGALVTEFRVRVRVRA